MSLFALFVVPVLFFTFFNIQHRSQTLFSKPKIKQVHSASIKKPIPTPTFFPTFTPTPTQPPLLKPTKQEVLSKQSIITNQIIPTVSENQDVTLYIMNAINEYRTSQGLSKVEPDSNTCSFAKIRAQEVSQNFNHTGFRERIDNKTLPYPSYQFVTENIAQTLDYKRVVQNWINSPGHAENMRKDTPFVCIEKHGSYYVYEGLRL